MNDNLMVDWKIDRAEQFLILLQDHDWNTAVRIVKARIAAELEAKELRKVS